MKKTLVSGFASLAILATAACGGSETEAPAPEATAETPPPAAEPAAPTPAPAAAPAEPAGPAPEFAALPEPYRSADYARGRRTFKLCQSCHLTDEGAGNLVGPNLHGIFGREAGAMEGFSYSKALQEADFIWTPEQLDHWLENPRTFLPGNAMSFAGVRKPDDRTAVTAYLMSVTGYEAPADAPAEEAPAEE